MRPLCYLPLLAALAACESDLDLFPSTVQWMEWPAEVPTATPFAVRLIVPRPGCYQGVFKPGVSADESAVTFAPYYLVKRTDAVCLPEALQFDIISIALDTVGTAPGLATSFDRTFEMRASSIVYAPSPQPSAGDLPVRTYGDVTVRLSDPELPPRNAAGFASKVVDNAGCVRLQPAGTIGPSGTPGSNYVLEDQADTTGLTYAFVRGYIHEATAPVCGQTLVFHLVSRF
jgi:hypothetical protein